MRERPSPASPWSVGGASVPGAAHLRRGAPNQDAIAHGPASGAGDHAILALSDGHGSAAHPRSDIGARLAVEAALAVLETALREAGAALPDPLGVGAAVIDLWRERVRAHLAANPRLPEEARADDPLQLYGATLVAAAATPRGVLVLQLGDGDLLVRFTDGAIVRPLPDDLELVGDQTYSLCLPDARERLRGAVVTDVDAIDLLMLSTDGLSKSFAHEADFVRLAGTWSGTLEAMGLDAVVEALPEWLSAASERGSGDDITLGFLLRSGTAPAQAALDPGAEGRRPRRPPRAGRFARLALAFLDLLRRPGASARPNSPGNPR